MAKNRARLVQAVDALDFLFRELEMNSGYGRVDFSTLAQIIPLSTLTTAVLELIDAGRSDDGSGHEVLREGPGEGDLSHADTALCCDSFDSRSGELAPHCSSIDENSLRLINLD